MLQENEIQRGTNIRKFLPSNQSQGDKTCNCNKGKGVRTINMNSPSVAFTKQQPCRICGSSSKGCSILSGFSPNSSTIQQQHKVELKRLAQTILSKDFNLVIAIGSYVGIGAADLGEKRAIASVLELKKQLSQLKAGAGSSIFWKTGSINTSKFINKDGNIRGVEFCLLKINI
jgi:hypothetical protein